MIVVRLSPGGRSTPSPSTSALRRNSAGLRSRPVLESRYAQRRSAEDGDSTDILETEWQFDVPDLEPVRAWLHGLSEHEGFTLGGRHKSAGGLVPRHPGLEGVPMRLRPSDPDVEDAPRRR